MTDANGSGRREILQVVVAVALLILVVAGIFAIQAWRAGLSPAELLTGDAAPASATPTEVIERTPTRRGPRIDFLSPSAVGRPVGPDDRPLVANVATVDLDGDGLTDVLVADAAANEITWIRQESSNAFSERTLAAIAGPAHVSPVDVDRDGDLDVVVASLGVLAPNNAPIGAVFVLENDGRQSFTTRTIVESVARVADVRAGDLDGDGDLDLAVAHFGYDAGETRWLENLGGWKFESHVLQRLSGVINAAPADIDADGDLDIVSLVSQEWEEIYVFLNDGRGEFTPSRVFGASNEDFGSSWISLADLDRDGDPDIVYSNGDAFDYAPPRGRSYNGVQWLENTGNARFRYHRLADLAGASSPQAADMDGDGDMDIVVSSAYNDWARPDAQSLALLENDGGQNFTLRDIASSPTHLITVAIGDLNGDGKPDLVTGGMHMSWPFDRMSRVTVWRNERR